MKVENIVVSHDLNHPLDLESLYYILKNLKTYDSVIYDPSEFPGIRLKNYSSMGVISITLFRTGKVIISGLKRVEDANKYIKDLTTLCNGESNVST